jgi:hypothetical protein
MEAKKAREWVVGMELGKELTRGAKLEVNLGPMLEF